MVISQNLFLIRHVSTYARRWRQRVWLIFYNSHDADMWLITKLTVGPSEAVADVVALLRRTNTGSQTSLFRPGVRVYSDS